MLVRVRPILWAWLMLLAASAFGKPNVVVVLADGEVAGAFGRAAGLAGAAPRLDSLGQASVRFERFLASPGGVATRAALLTGRHEFAAGVSHSMMGRNLLRPGLATLPEVLAASGYATGLFGSWQLGENFPCRPQDQGFQEVLTHGGVAVGALPDAWGNQHGAPVLLHNGVRKPFQGDCTAVMFREAVGWLRAQAAAGRPFFLLIAPKAPPPPAGAPDTRLAALDAAVGEVLATLDATGLAGETLVVFLADAGRAGGFDPAAGEGALRVPCFIRWPGKLAPRALPGLATPLDLLPTLAGWCGAPLPAGWRGDGLDLGPAVAGNQALPAERVVVTHAGGWPSTASPSQHRFRTFAVQDVRFRMVGLELFDLASDPNQTRNIFAEQPEAVARLTSAYSDWWTQVAPSLQQPVRYQIGTAQQPVVELSAAEWWPPRDIEASAAAVASQAGLRELLARRADPAGRAGLGAVTGRWFLEAAREGHYKVTLRLLPSAASPEEVRQLGRLQRGRAHVRVNREEVVLDVLEGAGAVSVGIDVDAGPLDLEAWFDGQLSGDKVLGAMFVNVERAGERKRNIHPEVRPAPGK